MRCGPYTLPFERTLVMGVLNVTPDSFSDGGKFLDIEAAVKQAKQMVDEGADIIDVGGESSRSGSDPVSQKEELARVVPVIKRLSGETQVPISIDTYKAEVARAALHAGACMINDIGGLRDEAMVQVAAEAQAPVVVMHMQGKPKTMQEAPEYDDVVADVMAFLRERIEKAEAAGVREIIVDPGIGFGKTLEHNLEILRRLKEFERLKRPILIGPSRKSFIGTITDLPVEERLEGTIAASVIGAMNGANMVRVHDVKECVRALKVVDAIVQV